MRERGQKTKYGSGHVLVWDGLALAEPISIEPEAEFLQPQVMR